MSHDHRPRDGLAAGYGHAGTRSPGGAAAAARNLPLVLLGVQLLAGSALAFAAMSLSAGGRRPVLAVAAERPAGHVLANGDLTVVRVAASPAVRLLPEEARGSVVGRPVAVPVAAGSLLTREAVGPATVPPAGQSAAGWRWLGEADAGSRNVASGAFPS